ncbi:MAG: VapC toxin family PIN domain ribonuclease [Aquificota bacterium]|nr:MAG: VapC toxin family PIN domain ribonuclease [Aquificota bacterium]
MILYLDTSALIKLYVSEPGTGAVKEWVNEAKAVSTSRVAYVEARAGIARKYREGEFSVGEYRSVLKDLEKDWRDYLVVEVSEEVATLGGDLTDKHPLRGFDAIHLASALFLKARVQSEVSFSCFDLKLGNAAEAEGLVVLKA